MTTIWGDEGNEFDFYSALPGMLYQAEHAYTAREVDEVDAALLRRKFDGIVGADLDDYIYASKLECVPFLSSYPLPGPPPDTTPPTATPSRRRNRSTPRRTTARISPSSCSGRVRSADRETLKLPPWLIPFRLLPAEPFFSFLSPQYDRIYDLESHYTHLASYLEQALSTDMSTMSRVSLPHSLDDVPLNHRLRLPYLLASVLSLKCHLRQRLVAAYKTNDREELEALGGKGEHSRMSRLRALVKRLHAQHRYAPWQLCVHSLQCRLTWPSVAQRELVRDVQAVRLGGARPALRRAAESARNDARAAHRLP